MFKNYLKDIEGIATYPVLSLVVFFVFFTVIAVWLIRADKKQLDEMAQLPFNDNNENNSDQFKN